jgi:hypothetical protein
MTRENVTSSRLPGGDLVAALFNREVMALADRGSASNLIGQRWGDLAAAYAATWIGQERPLPGQADQSMRIVRVERLDAIPQLASAASRRSLKHPDLLLVGERNGQTTVQAADAKFSVETARAKQVSPEGVLALRVLQHQGLSILPVLDGDIDVVPGVFLSPDYLLTHLSLRGRQGIVRPTVSREEVVLVPVHPESFWDGVSGATIMAPLAMTDDLPLGIRESLLAGVYYFRLARAAVGCWIDATKPLLSFNDGIIVDEEAVRVEAARRSRDARSTIDLIRQWDADVEAIRRQRAAIDEVTGFPIPGRSLRTLILNYATAAGGDPPSTNQVRRRVGAWYRGALREQLGPILPPVTDLPATLQLVAKSSHELARHAECELARVVRELVAEQQKNGEEEQEETEQARSGLTQSG